MEDLLNKKWETKDGYGTRVVCVDAKGKYPIICLICEDDTEHPISLTSNLYRFINDTEPFIFEVDKFKDLKRCESEGAIIEIQIMPNIWKVPSTYLCYDAGIDNYRIKDNITIEQWDKHKEVIKAFWSEEKIEYLDDCYTGKWVEETPIWDIDTKYRVKTKTMKVTMQDIKDKFGCDVEIVSIGKPHE